MKIIKKQSYFGTITIGLHIGYTDELISKNDIIFSIQEYQNKLFDTKNIHLSVAISDCLIVLNKQVEPHLKLDFINYPKFPLEENTFKNEINNLAKYLMEKFNQNRIVITYHDETFMFEISDNIDPKIKKK